MPAVFLNPHSNPGTYLPLQKGTDKSVNSRFLRAFQMSDLIYE